MNQTPNYGLPLLTNDDDSSQVLNTFTELMWDSPNSAMSKIDSAIMDKIKEYSTTSNFPTTGISGQLYIAEDTNQPYRWDGSTYIPISANIELGEAENTAYRGDRGKIAYDHSQEVGNAHLMTANDIGLGNVPNLSTNDQIPTFTESESLDEIVSGDKLSVLFGKIKKWISTLRTGKADLVDGIVDKNQLPDNLLTYTEDVIIGDISGNSVKEYIDSAINDVNNTINVLVNELEPIKNIGIGSIEWIRIGRLAVSEDSTITCGCYGNGKFVFLAEAFFAEDTCLSSIDGLNWSEAKLNIDSSAAWDSICYGNNMFVATSSSNHFSVTSHIITSTDGVMWAEVNVYNERPISGICFGNGLFVAIQHDGTFGANIITSPDGITWSEQIIPALTPNLAGIAYGGGRFVSIATSGSTIYSDNGIDWITGTSLDSNSYYSICYGEDRFVVTGQNVAYVSMDGVVWEPGVMPENTWHKTVFEDGVFMSVATNMNDNLDYYAFSEDGFLWSDPVSFVDEVEETEIYCDKINIFSGNNMFFFYRHSYENANMPSFIGIRNGIATVADVTKNIKIIAEKNNIGRYYGVGGFGSANPCSITFQITPKQVTVCGADALHPGFTIIQGSSGSTSDKQAEYIWSNGGRTLSWYSTLDEATQLNDPNFFYMYSYTV
ncbi:hypothetical protein SDC9_50573 [bioreactor metagenome]|uniref:Uncharacterized protein n=1 Tax=bioreactor metagenome TaxID=1076179 RepID=A0A644WL34_9ZZZZ